MMDTTAAYRFNRDAKYQTGGVFHPKDLSKIINPEVQVTAEESFEAQYLNVFEKYRLPNVSSDKLVEAWRSSPMQFWQNQLNFAVWCASAGCGVSEQDHLMHSNPQIKSLYTFHLYFQIRRIFTELEVPHPQDQAWYAFQNTYNRRAYERICSEFGVSPHTDWHIKGPNQGLGRVYNYWTNIGYRPVGRGDYDSSRMSFTKETSNQVLHVDFLKQDNVDKAWTRFILDRSEGFTQPGVERLNDSIRTYVWAILGAQAQTRTKILGTGTAFDAQKQFLANVEDAISSPVDLSSAIGRYQDVLQYASSKLDFSFGTDLYMAPSDMLLNIGHVTGYNNKIIIATEAQRLGLNSSLNVTDAPHNASGDTGETGLVKPQSDPLDVVLAPIPSRQTAPTLRVAADAANHLKEKTALVVGGVIVGLVSLWLFR